ncbi:tetratricopeptide repeat protein [Candidatus Woesearchaeota archaeon]|nr:tetratricopeptide repeat protein [Candidatus Woesearchaeota archaeon]
MVIQKIKKVFETIRQRKEQEKLEKEKLESFRENEEMQKAELIKKEADRLAHLKQYKTAIDEYNKALEIYPAEESNTFKKAAEFLFKIYFNIAASYSFLGKFDAAINYFDKALLIENVDDENKVKALMSKGNCYYNIDQLLKRSFDGEIYHMAQSEINSDEKAANSFKKMGEKKNLLNLAHECFVKSAELERHNPEAWYKKGHMEFLLGMVKEAMLSFDNVMVIDKDYENIDAVELFDDIKREKGIKVKYSKVYESEVKFKTKTGHLVRNKAEKTIADFMFESNLLFQYNMAVTWADNDDFRTAFFIPKLELYIEHFEFEHIKDYQKMMKWKIKQYEKSKKKLIYTTSQDEKNMEEALKIKIKPYIVL